MSSKSSSSKASSSTSSNGVTVIWDYPNAWIPEGYDLGTLKTNIEAALKKFNQDFFILGKVIAIGPASGAKHEAISRLSEEIELREIPEITRPCETHGCENVVDDSRADLYVLQEMFMQALQKKVQNKEQEVESRSNILVIPGDMSFVTTAIAGFKKRDTFVMLALTERSFYDDAGASARARATWIWSSEDPKNGATMIKGGAPIQG